MKLSYKGGGDFINNHIKNCPKQFEGKTSSFYFFSGNGTFNGQTNSKLKILNDSIHLDEILNKDDSENDLCLKCQRNKRDCFAFPCKQINDIYIWFIS